MSRIYFLYFIKKHILKHKIVLCIFFVLLFPIMLGSCKTCDCPAYSKNNTYFEVLEVEKITVSHEDFLVDMQDPVLNNALNP